MHRCLAFAVDGTPRVVDSPGAVRQGEAAWLDLERPDREEIDGWLQPFLPLHPLAAARLEAAGRPRLQVYDRSVEMCFRLAAGDSLLTVLLGPARAVTVRSGPAPAVDAAWQAYVAAGERAHGAELAIYHVLDHVVGGYERLVGELVDAVERMNLNLPGFRRLRALRRIVVIRRRAFDLLRLVAPAVDLFGLLEARDFPFVQRQHRAFFEDLHARARAAAADVESARDLLAQDVESLTAVQSQRVNNAMKLLTLISVVFLPGTLIASIYGMNFKIPEYGWSFGYAWSLGLILLVTGALVWLIFRRGWLD